MGVQYFFEKGPHKS